MTLLGAPITEGAVEPILREKLKDLVRMGERLETLDAHDALFLLRNAFAIPKLMYLLRTTPFFKFQELLQLYDDQLKNSLQSILNITLQENAWAQCILPVAKGGLGVRMASDLSLPAFLASAHGAGNAMATLLPEGITNEDYQLKEEAYTLWNESLNNNNPLQPSNTSVQAAWDQPLVETKYNQLLSENEDNPTEKARLLAVASEHSSDWLHAVPLPSLGLKLDDASLRIACGLRLGTPLCHPHKCQCGAEVDKTGRHGLSCKSAEGRLSRHSQPMT